MSNRKKIIIGVLIGAAIVIAMAVFYIGGQNNRRFIIAGPDVFRIQVSTRPPAKYSLKTIVVDLSPLTTNEPCELVFRLHRASLGSIDKTYLRTKKADDETEKADDETEKADDDSFAQTNISFVDFTKQIHWDGAVTSWDVNMAESSQLRLKVWRELGAFWQVIAQSEVVTPVSGLNHFKLNPPLPVKQGNYIGLYVEKPKALKLTVSRKVGPGDGGGAVHPFTLIDLTKVAPRDGILTAWAAIVVMPGEVKLKVWRRSNDLWRVVGQSKSETVKKGYNKFSLNPVLPIQKGDYLGYFTGNPPQEFPQQVHTAATNIGKLYMNGDFEGETADAQMYRDNTGNYSFCALYAPDKPQGESGLNHFKLNPPLPVNYIGLYVEKPEALELTVSKKIDIPALLTSNLTKNVPRRPEAVFKGDVAFTKKTATVFLGLNPCRGYKVYFSSAPVQDSTGFLGEPGDGGGAVHPFTLIDLTKVAPRDGILTAWEAIAVMPGEVKLKVWRRSNDLWKVVGQSKSETVKKGYNKFSLNPILPIQKGDHLGYFTGNPPQEFPPQAYTVVTNTGKLYVNGDFKGEIAETQMYRDNAGNHSFRALYAPREPQGELRARLNLKPGRHQYLFELPEQNYGFEEPWGFSIESVSNASAVIHWRIRNIWSGGGGYVGLEYNQQATVSEARVVLAPSTPWLTREVGLVIISCLGLSWILIVKRKWLWKLFLPFLGYLFGLILVVLLLVNLISNFGKNDFSERDDFRDLLSVMRTDCVPGTALLSLMSWEYPAFDYYRMMMYTRLDIQTVRYSSVGLNAKWIKECFEANNIEHLPAFFDNALADHHTSSMGKDYDMDKEFTLYRIESKHPLRFIVADYANFVSWQAMTNRALYYALPKGVQGTLDAPSLHVSRKNNAEFSRLVLSNLRYAPEAEALMIQDAAVPVNLLVPKVPGKKMSLTLGLAQTDVKDPCAVPVQGIEILFYLNNTIKSLQTFDMTAPTQEVKLEFAAEELASPFNILSLVPLADSINGKPSRIPLSCLYKINYIDIRVVD